MNRNTEDRSDQANLFYPDDEAQLQSIAEEDEQSREKLNSRFASLSDEEVVLLSQGGDVAAVEYLLTKFKNYVRAKAHSYFLIGADHEDIVQEGMIGLFKAMRDYQPQRQASFHAFAELCITRQILTAIKSATRRKHAPLNTYVSLNKPIYENESERTLMDILPEHQNENPEDMIIGHENMDDMLSDINVMLTPLEQGAIRAYLQGDTYQKIAKDMGRGTKSIDNAIQRVKRKLEAKINEDAKRPRNHEKYE